MIKCIERLEDDPEWRKLLETAKKTKEILEKRAAKRTNP